jgi:mannose-6-phosphate isomerase-like protein (cupin superfamily)
VRALASATVAILLLACRCVVAQSAAPGDTTLWTAAGLELLDKTLVSGMGKSGAAYMYVLRGASYGALLLHREATGSPELHVKVSDFFVVLAGEGEVRVGGRVSGQRATGPDEYLGRDLVGGSLYAVKQGDVLFIPANHWLQVLVAKGKVLRALVIKAR